MEEHVQRIDTALLEAHPLTSANVESFKQSYTAFHQVAQAEYGWPSSAIDFETLKKIIAMGIMRGFLLQDVVKGQCIGFLLYQMESYGALEIKVIYIHPDWPIKSSLDTLLNPFLEHIKTLEGWQVLSYPMLGPGQARYLDFITWYGFKPIGQAVVKFNLFDGITIEIFKKIEKAALPEGYRLDTWRPEYEAGVIDVLTEAFAESVDALWDPRFRSREGMTEAMKFVQSGGYGVFHPSCTGILLNAQGQPVGVCLLNLVSPGEANIPLIGLLKSERKHRLGKRLLSHTVECCIDEVLKGKLPINAISATVATGNIPAIRMYRHVAFQEDHWYTHAYQDREKVLARRPGQWC